MGQTAVVANQNVSLLHA